METPQRPLSPHLEIYRFRITMFTSILHRALNGALAIGLIFLAVWILSIAVGGDFYTGYNAFLSSWLGQIMLFAWTYAAFYNIAHWVRHFAWDLGYWFELETAQKSGWIALIVPAVLTVLMWLYILIRG